MSKPKRQKKTKASPLIDLIEVYWDDPAAFAIDILGFDPDDWQLEAFKDVAESRMVSIRSGQGVGKTAFEAILILWFLCCRPNPKVVCTAPTRQQLHDVLWAEVAKWLESSLIKKILKWTKTKVYMIGHEERWFATARTATKPENMAGFHEDHMLFLVDEASGVADKIMETINGTLTGEDNKLVMCGNPTRTNGFFFDSHNSNRENFRTRRVSARTSKRTSKENIAMLERKYGKESNAIRVRVDGDFPTGDVAAFIALELGEFAAQEVKAVPTGSVLTVGVDVARFGEDRTEIYAGIGKKVVGHHSHHKQDTMVTAGWVVKTTKDAIDQHSQVERVIIRIDDTGVGGGVTDRLREIVAEEGLSWEIVPINNNGKTLDEHYADLGAEMWGSVRSQLEQNMTDFIAGLVPGFEMPNDDELIAQLTARKQRMTSKGKIALESKDDMKKRGLKSPDKADAFVLCFADYLVEPDEHIMLPSLGGVTIRR